MELTTPGHTSRFLERIDATNATSISTLDTCIGIAFLKTGRSRQGRRRRRGWLCWARSCWRSWDPDGVGNAWTAEEVAVADVVALTVWTSIAAVDGAALAGAARRLYILWSVMARAHQGQGNAIERRTYRHRVAHTTWKIASAPGGV